MADPKKRSPSRPDPTSGEELYDAVVWLADRIGAPLRPPRRRGKRLFEHLFEEARARAVKR